jgi:hypothetical protein
LGGLLRVEGDGILGAVDAMGSLAAATRARYRRMAGGRYSLVAVTGGRGGVVGDGGLAASETEAESGGRVSGGV